uniref:Uncharacterized protein n=1 Tax=Cacopsylla melanoneura TaxID=428564 RepID=A0A8D8RDV4_9HEMI
MSQGCAGRNCARKRKRRGRRDRVELFVANETRPVLRVSGAQIERKRNEFRAQRNPPQSTNPRAELRVRGSSALVGSASGVPGHASVRYRIVTGRGLYATVDGIGGDEVVQCGLV